MITRGTPVPPWRQLAEILRGQITSGELTPGSQLPSALALSERYEVAVPTVRKALNLLKSEGLIVGVAGYGTFVAQDRPAPPPSERPGFGDEALRRDIR